MKYNLSLFKNRKIGFEICNKQGKNNDKKLKIVSLVKNIKQGKEYITFTLEQGKLDVLVNTFSHMLIRYDEEMDIVWLIETKDITCLTSFVGFTMFDTYGFPIEMTQEIVKEKGFDIDLIGFDVLKKLQKDMSNGTYKNKNAF